MRTNPAKTGSTEQAADCSWISHHLISSLEKTHEVFVRCNLVGTRVEVYVPILLQESARALRAKMLTSASSVLNNGIVVTMDGVISESAFPKLIERLASGCCGPCVVVYDHKTFNVIGG